MKTQNEIDYLPVINSALPGAMIRIVENFDDIHRGFEITPDPGVLIRFMIDINANNVIAINVYLIHAFDATCTYKRLYYGNVPLKEDYSIDMDFLSTFLKNWKNIG